MVGVFWRGIEHPRGMETFIEEIICKEFNGLNSYGRQRRVGDWLWRSKSRTSDETWHVYKKTWSPFIPTFKPALFQQEGLETCRTNDKLNPDDILSEKEGQESFSLKKTVLDFSPSSLYTHLS